MPADLYIARVGSDHDGVVGVSSEQSGVLTGPHAWRLRLSRHHIDESPPGLSSLNPGKRFNDLACDVWVDSEAHSMRWYAAYSIFGDGRSLAVSVRSGSHSSRR